MQKVPVSADPLDRASHSQGSTSPFARSTRRRHLIAASGNIGGGDRATRSAILSRALGLRSKLRDSGGAAGAASWDLRTSLGATNRSRSLHQSLHPTMSSDLHVNSETRANAIAPPLHLSATGPMGLAHAASRGLSSSIRASTLQPLLPLVDTLIALLGGEGTNEGQRTWDQGSSSSGSSQARQLLQESSCGAGLVALGSSTSTSSAVWSAWPSLGSSGSIVSAAQPSSTCGAGASSEAILMAEITGAAVSLQAATSAIRVRRGLFSD